VAGLCLIVGGLRFGELGYRPAPGRAERGHAGRASTGRASGCWGGGRRFTPGTRSCSSWAGEGEPELSPQTFWCHCIGRVSRKNIPFWFACVEGGYIPCTVS
jgi:hypothetical protein